MCKSFLEMNTNNITVSLIRNIEIMIYERQKGVPKFECTELQSTAIIRTVLKMCRAL